MAWSLSPAKLAKQELLKIDENHNGKPDALEALEALEGSLFKVEKFVSTFDTADVVEILHLLPARVKAKFSDALIEEIASELTALPQQLKDVENALQRIEASLKDK